MEQLIAFDFGVKKMGVAVGNSLTKTSRPLDIVPMNNGQPDWQNLIKLITEWQASIILVGLPINMDGTDSHLSKRANKFAKRLNHQLKEKKQHIPIYLVDERLSSFDARTTANTKKTKIDDVAASILIDSWFENQEGILL